MRAAIKLAMLPASRTTYCCMMMTTVARPYLRPIWGYFITPCLLSAILVQTKYVSTAAIYSS